MRATGARADVALPPLSARPWTWLGVLGVLAGCARVPDRGESGSSAPDPADSGADGGDSGADVEAPGIGDPCQPAASDPCAQGLTCCAPCCASDATPVCVDAGSGPGTCPVPDLSIDPQRLAESLVLSTRTFTEESCAVVEGCVGGTGERRLLRFTTTTPNLGTADLFLGDPASDPEAFEWSPCHGHYHYSGFVSVELTGADGVLAVGTKQAFCLMDAEPWASPTYGPQFYCGHQGITVGWADTYDADLDCQWVDVTDVPAGTYTLRLRVDPEDRFPEVDESDNMTEVTVEIPVPG